MSVLNTASLLERIGRINANQVDDKAIEFLAQLKVNSYGDIKDNLTRLLAIQSLVTLGFDEVGDVDAKIIQKAVQDKITQCGVAAIDAYDPNDEKGEALMTMISHLTPFDINEVFLRPERQEDPRLLSSKTALVRALGFLQILLFKTPLNPEHAEEYFEVFTRLIKDTQAAALDYKQSKLNRREYLDKLMIIAQETLKVTHRIQANTIDTSLAVSPARDEPEVNVHSQSTKDTREASFAPLPEPAKVYTAISVGKPLSQVSKPNDTSPPPAFIAQKSTQTHLDLNLQGKTNADLRTIRSELAENTRLSFLRLENCSAKQLNFVLRNNEANDAFVVKDPPQKYWTTTTRTRKSPPITQLEIVNPAEFYLQENPTEASGEMTKVLCPALENNRTIETLVLNHAKIDDEGLILLDRLLANNNTISHLILKDNVIANITKTQHLGQLTSLSLSDNHLDDEAATKIAEILTDPLCKITELDLSNCFITEDGANALAMGVKNNQSLRVLRLNDNQFSLAAQENINQAAGLKTSVTGLELTEKRAALYLEKKAHPKKRLQFSDRKKTLQAIHARVEAAVLVETKKEKSKIKKDLRSITKAPSPSSTSPDLSGDKPYMSS